MQTILSLLRNLDKLYHTDNLEAYEQYLRMAVQHIEQSCPGVTIAYAEIYTTGSEREAHGGMRHVLLPHPE